MGRKSPLTEKQWAAVERRLLAGESARFLGEQFGVSDTAIRKRFGSQQKEIKSVANQLVAAELAFSSLPISSQIKVRTLADELKDISMHLASAAKYGAATAHRLHGIAHAKVTEIDDAAPLNDASMKTLKVVHALTMTANAAAELGMDLVKVNKDIRHGDADDSLLRQDTFIAPDEPIPHAPIL